KVGAGATIAVERNLYSVPARLIGEWVDARLSAEIVQVWYGQEFLVELPRLRGRYKHRIDYRHVIDWLVRKPGAFAEYRYQADLSQCLRDAGAASPAGSLELPELPAGAGDARVPGTTAQTDRAFAARIPAAVGEEPADLRPQAFAGEGGAPVACLAGGELCRSARERAGLWQARLWENPSGVRAGPGTGARGPAGVVQFVQLAGAGVALGQA